MALTWKVSGGTVREKVGYSALSESCGISEPHDTTGTPSSAATRATDSETDDRNDPTMASRPAP
eukprot:3804694-Rhodomonas_salina.1